MCPRPGSRSTPARRMIATCSVWARGRSSGYDYRLAGIFNMDGWTDRIEEFPVLFDLGIYHYADGDVGVDLTVCFVGEV